MCIYVYIYTHTHTHTHTPTHTHTHTVCAHRDLRHAGSCVFNWHGLAPRHGLRAPAFGALWLQRHFSRPLSRDVSAPGGLARRVGCRARGPGYRLCRVQYYHLVHFLKSTLLTHSQKYSFGGLGCCLCCVQYYHLVHFFKSTLHLDFRIVNALGH